MLSVFEIVDLCCLHKVERACQACGGSDASATKRQRNRLDSLMSPMGSSNEELSQYLLTDIKPPVDVGTVYYDALESVSPSQCPATDPKDFRYSDWLI